MKEKTVGIFVFRYKDNKYYMNICRACDKQQLYVSVWYGRIAGDANRYTLQLSLLTKKIHTHTQNGMYTGRKLNS